MTPVAEGSTVRVIQVDPGDPYVLGEIVEVTQIACDGTFRGREIGTGEVKGWLNWAQVEEGGGIGWDFLAGALSPRGRRLLEAFDGHRFLQLKRAVEDELVLLVPDLEQEILAASAHSSRGPEAAKKKKRRGVGNGASDSPLSGSSVAETAGPARPIEDFDVEGELGWATSPP